MAIRFLVVSMPRSGTHMLRTLLNQHSNIRIENELFNEDAEFCDPWRDRTVPWVLEQIAWREGPEQIRGCLAHLEQGHRAHTWQLWDYLLELKDVRFVCMRRFNLLEQFVSVEQALIHQRWQLHRGDTLPPLRPMSFEPTAVEHYFRRIGAHWRWFDRVFADRPQCTVWYEDLCRDTDRVSRQTQEFLGAATIAGLQPGTIKVGRPASELITNYYALRKHFSGTPYAKFFEENHRSALRRAA